MENNSNEEISFKEKRIRDITTIYYSIPEIKKAIFEFSKNRECVPRYFEGFGKRPDTFQYDSEIIEQVRKGATSFHCSEEIWDNPLDISTSSKEKELNALRTGWDLLLDIDSPYLEYSKIYAELVIQALEFHGIKNIGVKFSVSGDTDILIKHKDKIELTRIEKAIELIKKGEKLEVLSLDKERRLKFSKIYDYLEHEDNLYNIFHSQSKVPLKATGHHSVFVWDKGEIIQKKVTELKEGDFLISFNSKINPLINAKKELTNKFEFSKNQFSKKIIENKIEINLDLMRLIGYFLAEGHTTKIINQTGFSFNVNEKEYIEDCKNLLSKLTNRKISIRHPNSGSTQILIHSKEWHDFFKDNCGERKNKHLPEFAWSLPKELFLELLKGYLRGDGYKIGEYGIVAKSVSKQLIKELIWLCKLNDISCSLSCEQNKPHILPQGNVFKGSFVYILKIPKSELSALEFNRPRNKFSPFPGDRVFPIEGLKYVYFKIKPKMFNLHRLEDGVLKKKLANLTRIKKVLDWFDNYKSLDYDDECRKIINNYKKLFESDISVVEIRDIIHKDKQIVYDVSVEETESFFGNDYPILLHNSGSKGLHIIVPWKAFPKEVYGQKTKDMFPEWPKIICQYLASMVRPKLSDKLFETESLKDIAQKTGKTEKELTITECKKCNRPAEKIFMITWICPYCKNEIVNQEGTFNNRKKSKCPECRKDLNEKVRNEIYYCAFCNINSNKNPENFEKTRDKTETLIDADLVLVASRHLFRMPYSLHEKTALSSVVLDKDKIKDFQITDAKPFKVKVKNFYPESEEDEAKELLLQALDWKEQKDKSKKPLSYNPNQQNNQDNELPKQKGEYKEIKIPNPTEDIYPPCIKLILQGVKDDGRKRALFILINFFKSIGTDEQKLVEIIEEWNNKGYKPLKQGYIQSQLNWYKKTGTRMPPNCDKTNYNDLNVCKPDELCRKIKNPVNYAVRKFLGKR